MTDKEWIFDRYRYGRLMAEGAKVNAKTEADALRKAEVLFADERKINTFKLRAEEEK